MPLNSRSLGAEKRVLDFALKKEKEAAPPNLFSGYFKLLRDRNIALTKQGRSVMSAGNSGRNIDVAGHRKEVQRIQAGWQKKKAEGGQPIEQKSEVPEAVEMFVPMAFMESLEDFLNEIDVLFSEEEDKSKKAEFYQKNEFTNDERGWFEGWIDNLPEYIMSCRTSEYDDIRHGADFFLFGYQTLCAVDITTAGIDDEVFEEKVKRSGKRNITDGAALFHSYKKKEKTGGSTWDGSYEHASSIANFPHLLLWFPKEHYSDIFKKLSSLQKNFAETPDSEESIKQEKEKQYLKIAIYVSYFLAESLEFTDSLGHMSETDFNSYTKNEKRLLLGAGSGTGSSSNFTAARDMQYEISKRHASYERAMDERAACIGTLYNLFDSMQLFAIKKLQKMGIEVGVGKGANPEYVDENRIILPPAGSLQRLFEEHYYAPPRSSRKR